LLVAKSFRIRERPNDAAGGTAKTILASAGFDAQMWTVPASGHGDAIYEDPAGYAARVIKFLDASFDTGETPAAKPTGH